MTPRHPARIVVYAFMASGLHGACRGSVDRDGPGDSLTGGRSNDGPPGQAGAQFEGGAGNAATPNPDGQAGSTGSTAAARAGVRIAVTGSAACPTVAAERAVGDPAPNSFGPEGRGGTIADGEQGVQTSCTVSGGPDFAVSFVFAQGAISLNLNGHVDEVTGLGTATVNVQIPDLADLFSSAPNACMLTAITTAGGVEVKNGAIWARYNCPMVVGTLPSQVCRLQGEVVIENCE